MTLGEKIRRARQERRLTQNALADGFITRNMLSKIENGSAKPSLETLEYISGRLKMPIGYFLSPDDDYSKYLRESAMPLITSACRAGDFAHAYDIAVGLGDISGDPVLCSVISGCAYRAALVCYENGMLDTAANYLLEAKKYADLSVIPAAPAAFELEALCKLIKGVDIKVDLAASRVIYANMFSDGTELRPALAYPYDVMYAARLLIERNIFSEAAEMLSPIVMDAETSAGDRIIVCGMLEKCYAAMSDYEHAYKISVEKQKLIK
ncbi:MAG: helix-turn-helix transcriptional regulator [Eubacteriales bacterium]